MTFRNDINGLRGIAVLAVVLFHFNHSWLSGGFSGVDIFFVISGFLMTSIILQRYDANQLNIWNFYLDRGRRILPALTVLCTALCCYGIYSLPPAELMQLGKHVLASLLFVSNVTYWSEAGYFDSASETKWLLHTWSLSVEWQFYLLYPFIVLIFIRLFGRKNITYALASVCVFSYFISSFTPQIYQNSSFYLLYARAWEMLCGGLVYLCQLHLTEKKSKLFEFSGLALVIATCIMMRGTFPWPGFLAMIPVLGACFILIANRQNSIFTNNPVLQYIGVSSYSVYLWHWPVVVFIRQHNLSGTYIIILGIFASLILGAASYHLVENKFRKKNLIKASSSVLGRFRLSILFIVASIMGGIVYFKQGLPGRYEGEISELAKIKDVYSFFDIPGVWRNGVCHSSPIEMSKAARIGKCAESGPHKLFMWGDSYTAALYPGLLALQKRSNNAFSIEQFTDGNGAPFFKNTGLADNKKNIELVNQEKLDILAEMKPEKVVITWMVNGSNSIQTHAEAVAGIKDTIARIKNASPDTRVIIIGPVPQWNNTLVAVMLAYWSEFKTYPPLYMSYGLNKTMFEWDALFKSSLSNEGVTYISALDILCRSGECLTRVNDDPKGLVTADWGHLSPAGSVYFVSKIAPYLLN
ncbi:acyltransferase [Enterobacter sp. Ap-1006]|uniref:acyltransferase family protein n=1 Tax=Enterobacter sp. Ap-1006 TaxID=2608345 RepID=UPI00141DB614|nr:acyltransferase family protein [Enterobacter sp. Ap-1006]NIF46977.1 acyltransferase [Enterobacter sp. Ap-1006]